jgi:2-amino-4-hydroxy-6-hydroxymethyldihydropteridine diphosphokinase
VIKSFYTVIALGANSAGTWGGAEATLQRAVRELVAIGCKIVARSRIYSTAPVGGGRQARYLNAVVVVRTTVPPAQLLRHLKTLEQQAGRRKGRHWGPRPLDLDIIDFRGQMLGWPCRRRVANRLILPHPEMHRRAFVLVPLGDIAPHWHHSGLDRTLHQLLAATHANRRNVRYVLDFQFAT